MTNPNAMLNPFLNCIYAVPPTQTVRVDSKAKLLPFIPQTLKEGQCHRYGLRLSQDERKPNLLSIATVFPTYVLNQNNSLPQQAINSLPFG